MKTPLLLVLLLAASVQARAQKIDSFHVNNSASPHQLFVRLEFPDSSYYVTRTFDRVALIYPPVNVVTFFYRSCTSVKVNPVRDTTILLYTPEPYGLWVWLATDTNTVSPDCVFATEVLAADSVYYDAKHTTGIDHPVQGMTTFHIFPNPAAGVLHVEGAAGSELRISDGLGRLQLSQQLQNVEETVPVGALVPGMYYIHCYRDGQLLQSCCFSKLP